MTKDLTKGTPYKVILSFSIPIIIGNLFQQIYNIVDTMLVGRLLGYEALAGVGITGGLTFLVMGFVLGITSGLGIKTAQLYGAGDMKGLKRSFATSIIICIALSGILTLIATLLCNPILHLIGTSEEIYEYAYGYVIIIFAGLSSQVAYNLIACILRSVGDSRTPLYFLIFSSVLNIVLDLLFIARLGLGVKGASLATITSQATSAIICFFYAFRRYPELRLEKEDFNTSFDFIWDHLRIGLPMALQFSITAFGVILLQAALNSFPATHIAGFTAANKVQNLGSIISISFGVAIANYVGQNFGAGDMARVRKGVNATLIMTLVVCLFASTLMILFADPLTELFLDGSSTIIGTSSAIFQASRIYLYLSAIFYPFLFVIFIFRNALQAIGKTFWPMMGGVLELIIRLIASFTLPRILGYIGIPLTDTLAWVGASILLVISYYTIMPKLSDNTKAKA